MSSCQGVRCDKCGTKALMEKDASGDKYPDGWGVVRLQRGSKFCDTGYLDLCPLCWTKVYVFAAKIDECVHMNGVAGSCARCEGT